MSVENSEIRRSIRGGSAQKRGQIGSFCKISFGKSFFSSCWKIAMFVCCLHIFQSINFSLLAATCSSGNAGKCGNAMPDFVLIQFFFRINI